MPEYRHFDPLDVLPANWFTAWQTFWSTMESNFALRIKSSDPTVLEVPAGTGNDQVGITIDGSPRFNTATVEYASPGGGTARSLDVWVVSGPNVFVSGSPGEVDETNYGFTLVIRESGVAPTGVAIKRFIGTAAWNGSLFTSVTPLVGRPSPSSIGALPANDPSVTNSRPPNGPASGSLSGTYPSPGIAAGAIGATQINAALKPSGSASAGTEALRALGTSGSTAAAGNDARLSDTRVPNDGSVTLAKLVAGLKPSGTATPSDEAVRALGTSGSTACAGNDARLSNQRGPLGPEFGLKLIRGSLGASGTISFGSGFTVGHPGTGVLNITFSTAFASTPTVVVGIGNGDLGADAVVASKSASACQIQIVGPSGLSADEPVEFFAIGPA